MKNMFQLVKKGFSLYELRNLEVSQFNFYVNELIEEYKREEEYRRKNS